MAANKIPVSGTQDRETGPAENLIDNSNYEGPSFKLQILMAKLQAPSS